MKTSLLIIFGIVMSSLLGYIQYADAEFCIQEKTKCPLDDVSVQKDSKYTLAELEWKQANFGIKNGTGFVTLILIDKDSNQNPTYQEKVNVWVISDSDGQGNIISLLETQKNSGVFEKKFAISNSRSAPNVLFTQEGDTATAYYIDPTQPLESVLFNEKYLVSTTLIGTTGPPLERAPATNPRISGLDGKPIESPIVGEQILLLSDLVNQQKHTQKFVWLAQIMDAQKKTVSLSWIDGTLNPGSQFTPSTSWIPEHEGEYIVTMFVWERIDNPTALSPPVVLEFEVIPGRVFTGSYELEEALSTGPRETKD